MRVPITKKPWFDNQRRWGWGWRPISWQGWGVMVVFIALCLAASRFLPGNVLAFELTIFGLILALVGVCYLTGGKPGSVWTNRSDK